MRAQPQAPCDRLHMRLSVRDARASAARLETRWEIGDGSHSLPASHEGGVT